MKKLQTSIAMNDSYVLYPRSLVSYRPFPVMLVWSVFFQCYNMFVCYYR